MPVGDRETLGCCEALSDGDAPWDADTLGVLLAEGVCDPVWVRLGE